MSGYYFPTNPSASSLPFGLPPHISSFLPRAEAINAVRGHSSEEMADARRLGNEWQEYHHQEQHHVVQQPGRFFGPSNGPAGYENMSQSCQYMPTNVNGGTEPRGLNAYLNHPYSGQSNGGLRYYNPQAPFSSNWILPDKTYQIGSGSGSSNQVQEQPFGPPLPVQSLSAPLSSLIPPLPSIPPPQPTPPPPPASPPSHVPDLGISGPVGHIGTKWKPTPISSDIFQNQSGIALPNTSSTGQMSRDHSMQKVPPLLPGPFQAFCFHCKKDGHEVKHCFKAHEIKLAKKRKLKEEKQGCCKRSRKGNHTKGCPSLTIVTQESGNSAKQSVCQWAALANAFTQGVGKKMQVANTSVDKKFAATGSSITEDSLQGSLKNEELPSAGDGKADNVASERIRLSDSNTKPEKKNPGKGSRVCILCKRNKGQHEYGCLNSKKFRSLRKHQQNLNEKFPAKLAQLKNVEKIRSKLMSEMSEKIDIRDLPEMLVESYSVKEELAKLPNKNEFLACVESIKRMPREKLEEIVLGHMYFCETEKLSNAAELGVAKQKLLNLQKQVDLIEESQKQQSRKKMKRFYDANHSIGIQTESMNCAVSGQLDVPLTVNPPVPGSIKVERVEENSSSQSSNEDRSDYSRSSLTIGNTSVAQLPYDPIVSSNNTTNAAVKIEKQSDTSSRPKKRIESLETTVTSRLLIQNSTKCILPHTGPANRCTGNNESSNGWPIESARARALRCFDQKHMSPSSASQSEPSVAPATTARQREQPSAISSSYQQPHIRNNMNQQKRRKVQDVQSDYRSIKLENIKVEANRPIETADAPNENEMQALGSRELPIEIE